MRDVLEEEGNYTDCEMCGRENIRYAHIMSHPHYPHELSVGCVCASNMSDDYAGTKNRETAFINRIKRRANWLTRNWKLSAKGNPRLKIDGTFYTVLRKPNGRFYYSIDGNFSANTYDTQDQAKLAMFDEAWPFTIDNEGNEV